MAKIIIINGTFGLREGGRITPKKAGDPPFDVPEMQAERLVALGVAKIVGGAPESLSTGDEMTNKQIKEKLDALGISYLARATKEELLALLESAKATEDDDTEDDDTEDMAICPGCGAEFVVEIAEGVTTVPCPQCGTEIEVAPVIATADPVTQ